MRTYAVMFAAAATPLSPPTWTTERGAGASFAGVSLARSGRYAACFIEMLVFAMLLALIALPAPARASFTVSSVTAAPATVQPGQTVVFTAAIVSSWNASNYPVEFSLSPTGASAATNTTQSTFYLTFAAGAPVIQAYGWKVPAGTSPGAYTMTVSVFSRSFRRLLASNSTSLTITAGSVPPTMLTPPVVSGTAQVGKVLSSTTGSWTGATSFAYQWAGNTAPIAGATAATYTPVSSDVGHTLTATVTATGPSGATASATSAPTVPIVAASGDPPPTGSVSFVPLHTYYMSPTGDDSAAGTSPSTAWASPAHAGLVCGDVIIAATGNYTANGGGFNVEAVSNCPSTTGGIDGTGGIYFVTVLCAGNPGTCTTSGSIDVTQSNWAVEGFEDQNYAGKCFYLDATASGTTRIGYVAFINDISNNCDDGYTTGDAALNHDVPGNGGDEFAVVGSIVYKSNNDPICVAALDDPGPANYDSIAGTHVFWYNNYLWNNNYSCGTDGESMMFDTWDAHGYTGQGVVQNNIAWLSARYHFQAFYQAYNSSAPKMYVLNNTFFAGNAGGTGLSGDWAEGDINIQGSTPFPWPITIQNNIVRSNYAYIGNETSALVYAFLIGGNYTPVVVGGNGTQNIFKGKATSCRGDTCDPGYNVTQFNGGSFGTNTYVDPAFTNTADLLASRSGAPNCTAFSNITACMGWNASTRTLSTPSVISDLTPTASGMTGKGFQLPSTTCAPNTLYPAWLKGVVYLHWNGSSLTENADLVTKPCNM